MAAGTRSLPTDSPAPYFQSLESKHVSEGVPSDIGSPEGALHGSVQMPLHQANSDIFLICLLVIVSTTLKYLNKKYYLPTLVSMTMTLYLRLDMVEAL